VTSVKFEGSGCAGIMKRCVPLPSSRLGSCCGEAPVTLDVRSLALRVLVCSQLAPVLPLGGCMSM